MSTTPLVDVFYNVGPESNSTYLDEMLVSVVNEPINLIPVQSVPGNLTLARRTGIIKAMAGPAKYIAWIDPDDLIIPGAFQLCVDAFAAGSKGLVFTQEQRIDTTGAIIPNTTSPVARSKRDLINTMFLAHHLCVFDKTSINQYSSVFSRIPGNANFEPIVKAIIGYNVGYTQIPSVGYQWRQVPGSHSKTPTNMRLANFNLYLTRKFIAQHTLNQ